MRDIKRRKQSIESTGQITKAMKLVATVKLQKAKAKAENSKAYFDTLYSTVCSILARTSNVEHPYLVSNGNPKKAVIALTSNRGLAGGYNNNIVKLISTNFTPDQVDVYAIGRKGLDGLNRKGFNIVEDLSEIINDPIYKDAISISDMVLKAYTSGEVGEIYLAYTNFKNTVTHEPKLMKLLPMEIDDIEVDEDADKNTLMNFEPDVEEALDVIIPKYMNNIIYGALIEAVASENGARMQAMDSATSNADDMIADLSLKYNRARQGSITQELTEIVAGSQAIS